MMEQEKVRIIVAAHKACAVPTDPMYLPLHVGAEGKCNPDGTPLELGFAKDNTGENISALNPCFCELTGLYWAWKNLNADYIGLVHYRRLFCGRKADKKDIPGSALSYAELAPLLDQYSVFVPKKRRYCIESLRSHYAHTLDERHLDVCRDIISQRFPEDLAAFDAVLSRSWGYMFNMMILRQDLLDDYCSWLFSILFELYRELYDASMTEFEKRFCGRVSEILFNVWLERALHAGQISRKDIRELNFAEDVAWGPKIRGFLAAKFLGKHYSLSASARGSRNADR